LANLPSLKRFAKTKLGITVHLLWGTLRTAAWCQGSEQTYGLALKFPGRCKTILPGSLFLGVQSKFISEKNGGEVGFLERADLPLQPFFKTTVQIP